MTLIHDMKLLDYEADLIDTWRNAIRNMNRDNYGKADADLTYCKKLIGCDTDYSLDDIKKTMEDLKEIT